MYIWMSLQAKCYRCGCIATIYIWMVAGGIQIQTGHLIKNFLFGIFETCFQSFLKTFWCFENLFLCFPKKFWSFTRIFMLSNGTPHTMPLLIFDLFGNKYDGFQWTKIKIYKILKKVFQKHKKFLENFENMFQKS